MFSLARWSLALLLATTFAACGGGSGGGNGLGDAPAPTPGIRYPATRAGTDSTTHFGQQVADPYRWLEESQSTPVIDWVRAQNTFSEGYVEGQAIYPTVQKRLEVLKGAAWVPEGTATPPVGYVVEGGGLQEDLQQEEQDFDDWRPDEAPADVIQVSRQTKSADQQFAAYTIRRNHADLRELYLVKLDPPGQLPRIVTNSSRGFMFVKTDLLYVEVQDAGPSLEGSYGRQAIMRLDLSAPDGKPEVLFQPEAGRPAGLWMAWEWAGQLFFQRSASTTVTDLMRLDLVTRETKVVLDGAGSTNFRALRLDRVAGRMLVLTSNDAAMNRLVRINPLLPQGGEWEHVLPTARTDVISDVRVCGSRAYAVKWVDGESRLESYPLERAGAPLDIPLPAPGHVGELTCSGTSGDLLYRHSTLAQPSREFRFNVASGTSNLMRTVKVPEHDPASYEVRQQLVRAVDGTQIPITLVHRKGLAMDGKAPTLVYVYGGFRTPASNAFNSYVLPLLEAGGVYVVAHVRGGGERGNAWYDAGRAFNKRNTYSDLADVARYLVAQGYTSASRLGVQGSSNGGTSSAVAALLYPELFAVALPRMGVHDLTRYTSFTAGYSWTRDYGDPAVQAEFVNLMTFSPLHSVQARRYPAIYVITGQNDQRVIPGHSYKLAAALQNVATGPGPYLMHSFASSGHHLEGERLRAEAHALTFFFTQTGTTPAPAP